MKRHRSGEPSTRMVSMQSFDATGALAGMVGPALAALLEVLQDPDARAADKIKAADSILDRAGISKTMLAPYEGMAPDLAQQILRERLRMLSAGR